MNPYGRPLTAGEKAALKRSVREKCSLYDKEYGCLALNSGCQIFAIGFTSSSLCRYYEECVLPTEPEIMTFLDRIGKTKNCPVCGRSCPVNHRQKYCSRKCATIAKNQKNREVMRRLRNSR